MTNDTLKKVLPVLVALAVLVGLFILINADPAGDLDKDRCENAYGGNIVSEHHCSLSSTTIDLRDTTPIT